VLITCANNKIQKITKITKDAAECILIFQNRYTVTDAKVSNQILGKTVGQNT
jgi:phosphoribosylaminoimidazole-succinocarboxamide synthase